MGGGLGSSVENMALCWEWSVLRAEERQGNVRGTSRWLSVRMFPYEEAYNLRVTIRWSRMQLHFTIP